MNYQKQNSQCPRNKRARQHIEKRFRAEVIEHLGKAIFRMYGKTVIGFRIKSGSDQENVEDKSEYS